MIHSFNNQPHLLNLIDTPVRLKFTHPRNLFADYFYRSRVMLTSHGKYPVP